MSAAAVAAASPADPATAAAAASAAPEATLARPSWTQAVSGTDSAAKSVLVIGTMVFAFISAAMLVDYAQGMVDARDDFGVVVGAALLIMIAVWIVWTIVVGVRPAQKFSAPTAVLAKREFSEMPAAAVAAEAPADSSANSIEKFDDYRGAASGVFAGGSEW